MDKLQQAVLAIKSTQSNSKKFDLAYATLLLTLSEVIDNPYIHGTGSAYYGTYTEGKSDYDFNIFEDVPNYSDVVAKYEALGFTSCSNPKHPIPDMYLVMRDSNNINLIITNSYIKFTRRNALSDIIVNTRLPKDAVVTLFHTFLQEPLTNIY